MQSIITFIKNYFTKDWVVLLLVVLLTVPTFITLLHPYYFFHQDDLHAMRIFEMEQCFKDWQIPCRWVPDMGNGYGYPLFNYYPPFPFYLGALLHLLPIQFVTTVKLLFILQIITGALFMYLFSKTWWGRLGGIVSALSYTYAPYHAVDLYVRGAINESWALAFAPGIAWAMTRIYKNPALGNALIMALMTAGMLLSHNLMVMIFAPLFGLFALYLLWNNRSVRFFAHLVVGGLLGVGLAAFFTLPVLVEQKYAHIESLTSGYFHYSQHFVSLKQLFFDRTWGYGDSVFGTNDGLSLAIGPLLWLGVLVSGLLAAYALYKRNLKIVVLSSIFIAYFVFSAFMTHERSNTLVWTHISTLQILQFPWRFLSPVIFSASFLIGIIFLFPFTSFIRRSAFIAISIAFLVGNSVFFSALPKYQNDDQKLQGYYWERQQGSSIFDYLPIYAVLPPAKITTQAYEVFGGNPAITNLRRTSNRVQFESKASTDTTVRMHLFDFPNWRVFIDGQPIQHNHENFHGLVAFTLPQGQHNVIVKLTNTPIRTVGNTLTLVSLVFLLGWVGYTVFKTSTQKTEHGN